MAEFTRREAKAGPPLWSLQYLRAGAALMVVAFHSLESTELHFAWGASGVDLFFCLSGFLMGGFTSRRDLTWVEFSTDRFTRIAPLYWWATAMYVAAELATRHLFWRPDLSRTDLLLSLLFVPHRNIYGVLEPVVGQGWTLNYEMFFYSLCAATLMVRPGFRLALLTLAIAALVAWGAQIRPAKPVLQTYTDARMLEFVAGLWLANAWRKAQGGGRLVAFVFQGLLLSATLALSAHAMATARYGAGASLVLTAALTMERSGHMPRIGWLKRLGDASYSLYLFQGFGLAIALRLSLLVSGGLFSRALLNLCLSLAASIGIGLAAFVVLERPTTALARRSLGRLTGRPAALPLVAGGRSS